MKLVHKSLTVCSLAGWALFAACPLKIAAQGPSTPLPVISDDPGAGFEPAQPNLAMIFLQLAGSLEAHGTPEPYIKHVLAEHKRLAGIYKAKTGRELANQLPPYMTDEYVSQFLDNWKLLESKLHLNKLARSAGSCIRTTIQGTQGNGTTLVAIFNHHQQLVANSMQTAGQTVGFERLQTALIVEFELGRAEAVKVKREQLIADLVAQESALSKTERSAYASLLKHKRFTKAEFEELERFYSGPYDKLSEHGKDQLSSRVWAGAKDAPKGLPEQALPLIQPLLKEKAALYEKVEAAFPPEKAGQIETVIDGMFISIGRLAQAELELGILASALR